MNPSAGRILTTHSGSLPRPLGFLPVLLARDAGQANDAEFFDATRAAVQETVQREADAGVDVLNDGEMSKPSYATYVKDRLTGFGGQGSMQNVRGADRGAGGLSRLRREEGPGRNGPVRDPVHHL